MQQRETRSFVKDGFVQLQRNNEEHTEKKYKVLNISRGGLCFESNGDEFELNETLKLSVTLDQKQIHSASGRVCYCKSLKVQSPSTYGLSFLDNFIDTDVIRSTTHRTD